MSPFLRIFRHLLPNARAWRFRPELETEYSITSNTGNLYTSGDGFSTSGQTRYVKEVYRDRPAPQRFLYKFINGLAQYPAIVRAYIDLLWSDLFPLTTSKLEEWETEFNLLGAGTESERRADLDSAWKAQGGQGLDYLQGLLWAAGFTNVYLHEWWIDFGGFTLTRSPFSYLDAPNNPLPSGGILLVNKGPTIAVPEYPVYLGGPDTDCGSSESECAGIEGVLFYAVEYDLPVDSDYWPYFIYVGAQTFPDKADVPASRRAEFERLLLRYFPGQQWLGLLINYV